MVDLFAIAVLGLERMRSAGLFIEAALGVAFAGVFEPSLILGSGEWSAFERRQIAY